ncbi:MAG: hypothetical protein K2L15_02320 [Eubacteriales bacterium]|nr:hypothetical protein [Eubacteriales bacterium]
MNEAKELIKTLENLDIQLFDIVNKIKDLEKVCIAKALNSYTKKPKEAYPNFVIEKTKDSLTSELSQIKTAINHSKLIEKIMSYQLMLAGAVEVIKLDIEEE